MLIRKGLHAYIRRQAESASTYIALGGTNGPERKKRKVLWNHSRPPVGLRGCNSRGRELTLRRLRSGVTDSHGRNASTRRGIQREGREGRTPIQMLAGYAKAGEAIPMGKLPAYDGFRHIDHADWTPPYAKSQPTGPLSSATAMLLMRPPGLLLISAAHVSSKGKFRFGRSASLMRAILSNSRTLVSNGWRLRACEKAFEHQNCW